MPVIAAGVVTKTGRILVARCFMDVTRIRIEGLLSAFPKLLGSGTSKQTTFIDSGNVRYLYQPIEGMFLVTVTTKASNIMEDLATLRLLGRVFPEYCGGSITEESVVDKAFEIMFAMDEILTNGAREATTMDQVLTALEMRSEAEDRAQREEEDKKREAAKYAKAKAKELKKKRQEMSYDGPSSGGMGGGMDSAAAAPGPVGSGHGRFSELATEEAAVPKAPVKKLGGGMSLSNKRKQDQAARVLAETGGSAAAPQPPAEDPAAAAAAASAAPSNDAPVNVRVEEKVSVALNREGGVNAVDVSGSMFITVVDQAAAMVRIHMNPGNPDFAFKTHPNINKAMYTSDSILAIKDSRPYPMNQALGIVKWRAQALAKTPVPISITCWPSDTGATIEYELENTGMVLENVVVSLPLAGGFPTVSEVTQGDYQHDSTQSVLHWRIGRVDGDETSGSMEVGLEGADPETAFFPANVRFSMPTSMAGISVRDVVHVETGASVEHAFTVASVSDSYTVE